MYRANNRVEVMKLRAIELGAHLYNLRSEGDGSMQAFKCFVSQRLNTYKVRSFCHTILCYRNVTMT